MAWTKLRKLAELIKWEHTIFALPFSYMGSFLAAQGWPAGSKIFWITVAMVGARSSAMAFNRLIDWQIDSRNPRTAGRHLPMRLVTSTDVLLLIIVSLGLLIFAAAQLNPLCVKLLPFVLLLVIYPYTKRFTWLSHFVLGMAIGCAPMGGWIAITGKIHPATILLGLIVCFWVAGFDIIYATLDYDFDRKEGLCSIPARFGIKNALIIARLSHVMVVVLLIVLGIYLRLDYFYAAGVLITAVLLHYEHYLASPEDLSKVNLAFFNVNGTISIILFVAVFLAIFM
ncbi:MAG TPA: 4-hydroxybenzoate octaprenyltransferase [Desulfotomaculum sp.]|nr:MAG: 4-hydroxybenzoate octaprenyltransferase [Desulfotomaculum sp. 46_80]HAG11079.1 4-hydroxybenzoate octaprenyltransferase [Desulfotomaculum sp.]HBY03607.1 4-hydroxybenzoate octaprenyltransferase [Desulfotomaculum sp.]